MKRRDARTECESDVTLSRYISTEGAEPLDGSQAAGRFGSGDAAAGARTRLPIPREDDTTVAPTRVS